MIADGIGFDHNEFVFLVVFRNLGGFLKRGISKSTWVSIAKRSNSCLDVRGTPRFKESSICQYSGESW